MVNPGMRLSPTPCLSRRGVRLLVLLAVLLAGGSYLGGRHLVAWRHLNAARTALQGRDLSSAQTHLESCLQIWPHSAEAHFLQARVKRLQGNLAEASQALDACAHFQGRPEAIELERALLHAQAGRLPGIPVKVDNPLLVEISLREPPPEMVRLRDYLQACLADGHSDSVLILEALIQGYIYSERTLSALHCVERLLELSPDHVSALVWHGELKDYYGDSGAAQASYARALELDPQNAEARWGLAQGLLRSHRPQEALEHFQALAQREEGPPELVCRMAQCLRELGRAAEASRLLDRLLAIQPGDVAALIERGKLALQEGAAAAAEGWLRRAVMREPHNREANYCLAQCLEALGNREEAKKYQDAVQRITTDLKRLTEINRELAKSPRDPALRYEMGVLLLRNGEDRRGHVWLASALELDPHHRPTHQALAEYYERSGQPARAAQHRLSSAGPP